MKTLDDKILKTKMNQDAIAMTFGVWIWIIFVLIGILLGCVLS